VHAGNLTHQREPQAGSLASSARFGKPIEGLEDSFPLGFRHARATVRDYHACHAFSQSLNRHFGRRSVGMALSVLEQIAQQPPQQSGVSLQSRRFATHVCIGASGLFRRERQQVHFFYVHRALPCLQLACQ